MILLLAGTSDARRLAEGLALRGVPALASLAGAVREPLRLPIPTRIGGFGGEEGFLRALDAHGIAAVIDATHPFAARITARTHALAQGRVPLLRLERPGWTPEPGDRWTVVADEAEAAARLPPDAVAFLATGRQSLPAWTLAFRSARAYLRVIDAPEASFPLPGGWVVGRPPFDAGAEAATFRGLGVTHLVAKDSGGKEGRGKLLAARALGLPVLLLRRPPRPERLAVVETAEAALDWALALPFRSVP